MDYKTIFNNRVVPRITITSTGCWEAPFADNGNGYKTIHIRPSTYYLHRLSYLAFVGDIPSGLNIMHKCDNRGCCNPEHLMLGTQLDNIRDMDAKGRRRVWHPIGDKNPSKQPGVRKQLSDFATQRRRNKNGQFTKSLTSI